MCFLAKQVDFVPPIRFADFSISIGNRKPISIVRWLLSGFRLKTRIKYKILMRMDQYVHC